MIMRNLFYLFLFLPQCLAAQYLVTLMVTQAPELSFTLLKQDTTIMKGSSVDLGNGLVVTGGSGTYSFKWSPGKSLSDSIILHPVASPADTTLYMLTVTDKNNCSFSVNYRVNVKTPDVKSDLIQRKSDLEAVIFPNPGKGNFWLKLSGVPAERIGVTIADYSGKIIHQLVIRDFQGNHTESFRLNQTNGVYHLRIESGLTVLNRSFIID
jgi:hypothetical protein